MKNSQRKANILMTCAGGSAVLYLADKLKSKFNIFLVDGSDHSAMVKHIGLPFSLVSFGNDSKYIPEIKKIVKKNRIDFIAPGADEEIIPLISAFEKGELPPVLAPSLKFCEMALDKKKTAETLFAAGISALPVFSSVEKISYPAVAKPRHGRGSREVHILKNAVELDGYLKLYNRKFEELAVEPAIDGDEYTVSVIVNDKNKIVGIVPKKVILKRGITRIAVSRKNQMIENACADIVEKFSPRGFFNVQLKLFNNKVYIFEINPRLSTTAVLTDQSFGNEIELFWKYFGKDKIENPPVMKEDVYLYRYDENYFKIGKIFFRL